MIQHRAACSVFNEFSSVTNMINKLKWTTLQCQRDIDNLIMFCKTLTSHISLDFQNYLRPNTSSARDHNLRYRQELTQLNMCDICSQHFPYGSSIVNWELHNL